MKSRFTEEDFLAIDARILDAMQGWKVEAIHKGSKVSIPGTWGAEIYVYKYFEVYKEATDVNPGEDENEIQCYLSCGWRGMDDEVVIVLTILGEDVLANTSNVGAELYRFGGDKIRIYKRGKLITDFTEARWWNKWFGKPKETHKAWARNLI